MFEFISVAQASSHTLAPVKLGEQFGFGGITSLSQGLGMLIPFGLSLAGTAVVIYFIYGAFKLTFSGGDKTEVENARRMITHGIIGFMLLLLMFLIYQFLFEFLGFSNSIIK